MHLIKIPNAIMENKLRLGKDAFFAVICLLLHYSKEYTPREMGERIAHLLCSFPLFERGFAELEEKCLVNEDGQLGGLFGELLSKRLCKAGKWGYPTPYRKFDRDKISEIIDGGFRKTALMVWLAMNAGIRVGYKRNGDCDFCGVNNKRVRVAKAKLLAAGLLPKLAFVDRLQKPYTVSGELEAVQIDSLIADIQQTITLELARKEGRQTMLSGMYTNLKQALPSSYLGFLRYQSQELTKVLEQIAKSDEEALKLVGRVPRVYIQGFTDGWNEERFQRGLELEIFAATK